MAGRKMGATFSSSRSSLKKKAALWAWKSGPRSSSWQVGMREGSGILLAMSTAAGGPETGGEEGERPGGGAGGRAAGSGAGGVGGKGGRDFFGNFLGG